VKLLLSAFIGSHNLGDEAIAEIIINNLEETPDVELTVLSVNQEKTRKLSQVKTTQIKPAGLGEFVRLLYRNDALVLGGGGIIQDESSIINMIYYYLQMFVAKRLLRKPIFWIFVGVGPIKTRLSHFMLRDMGRMASQVLVRDKESAALLARHGFTASQVITSYDIVFNYPIPKSGTTKYSGEYMLFCPRDWFFVATITPTRFALKRARKDPSSRLQVYRLHLLQLVEKCLQDNPDLTIVGVAFFYSQDLNLLQWIQDNLGSEYVGRYIVETKELTTREFIVIAKKSAAVLGVRLHSLILGAVAGRPLIPLVYSAKVGNLVNYLGVGEYTTCLDKPDFNVEGTAVNVQKALKSKPVQGKKMLESVRTSNLKAFDKLLESIRAKTARS
jgi:polysaccharide pyruvyl transferase CsaB